MAKKQDESQDDNQDIKELLGQQFTDATNALETQRSMWPELEKVAFGRSTLGSTRRLKSRVNEGTLASIIWEAASRELAQLPAGKFQALTMDDEGRNRLANLVFPNYVIPNSKAQFNHHTKLRLWNLLRKVYGGMPVMYDTVVRPDYVGPEFYIPNIYHYAPQADVHSFWDCDYHFISTFYTPRQLREKIGQKGWNKAAIERVLDDAGKGNQSNRYTNQRYRSSVSSDRTQTGSSSTTMIEVVTRYKKGRKEKWHSFCPDFDNEILRTVENKHISGGVNIVMMHSLPLLDTVLGLGEAEMNESMQKAIDTLVNLGLDSGKYGVFPPTIVNQKNVVASSIKWDIGAIWKEKEPNSIRQFPIGNTNINYFQTYTQHLKAAMLGRNATTDTTVTKETDAAFGKTPQALKQQAQREFARDNWAREMMEGAVEELYEGMMNDWAANQDEPFDFFIFEEEITQLQKQGFDDAAEGLEMKLTKSGKAGKVQVDSNALKAKYRYFIDGGTTLKEDDEGEHQKLGQIIMTYLQAKDMIDADMQINGKKIALSEMFERWLITSGVKNYDKLIAEDDGQAEYVAQLEQLAAAVEQQQAQAAQVAAQPQAMPQQMMPEQAPPQRDPEIQQAEDMIRGMLG